MKLAEFQKRFQKLRKKGWVLSHRKGPTGVGHTLEQELGMTENNIAGPDMPFAELKAHRANSSSLITLFTFNRKVWKVKPIEAVKKYGTPDENGRLGIYFTMGREPNSAKLFLMFEDEFIELHHVDGTIVASLSTSEHVEMLNSAFPSILLVSAEVETRGSIEYFNYYRMRILSGFNKSAMATAFRNGDLKYNVNIDFSKSKKKHETNALLVNESRIPELFEMSRDL